MTDKQMTPWFAATTKPFRTGVYEVRLPRPAPKVYGFWTGDRWGRMASTPEKAWLLEFVFVDWASQNKRWRGFTEKQK
jgi:hypothetical protein